MNWRGVDICRSAELRQFQKFYGAIQTHAGLRSLQKTGRPEGQASHSTCTHLTQRMGIMETFSNRLCSQHGGWVCRHMHVRSHCLFFGTRRVRIRFFPASLPVSSDHSPRIGCATVILSRRRSKVFQRS